MVCPMCLLFMCVALRVALCGVHMELLLCVGFWCMCTYQYACIRINIRTRICMQVEVADAGGNFVNSGRFLVTANLYQVRTFKLNLTCTCVHQFV
jgi:hypothetical protein